MNEQKYWDSFYSVQNGEIKNASTFAIFIKDYISKNDRVLELGCGNGRDTLYLKDYCSEIYAIDSSEQTINNLSSLNIKNANFERINVSNISNLSYVPTFIYSRFFLHSIDEQTENALFSWISSLPSNTFFSLECRSEKDIELPKYFGKTHYRRGINLEKLIFSLNNIGYDVIFKQESNGLAIYKDEDPIVIRLISRKK